MFIEGVKMFWEEILAFLVVAIFFGLAVFIMTKFDVFEKEAKFQQKVTTHWKSEGAKI